MKDETVWAGLDSTATSTAEKSPSIDRLAAAPPPLTSRYARPAAYRKWIWSSANADGCHLSWQAIIPAPGFFVPSYFLSLLASWKREREGEKKSVGAISDIYSLDDSWAERL